MFRSSELPRGEDARRIFRSLSALLGTPLATTFVTIIIERKTEGVSRIVRFPAHPARKLIYLRTISISARLNPLYSKKVYSRRNYSILPDFVGYPQISKNCCTLLFEYLLYGGGLTNRG